MSFGSNPSFLKGLKGASRMAANLDKLQKKISWKIEKSAIGAGLVPLTKAVRAEINNSSASKELKRAARMAVGRSKVKRYRGGKGSYQGKAGLGVGKPSKKKGTTAHERYVYGQGGAKLTKGVGVSATNIHWFVLGTKNRTNKKPHVVYFPEQNVFRTVQSTKQIVAVLKGVVPRAANKSQGAILAAQQKRAKKVLARETAKLTK